MKKRKILAILAALSVVLVSFTACGDKDKDKDEEKEEKEGTSVVAEETTEANGDAEEVTQPSDHIEYIEVTEVVTDADGEAVTDDNGETQVETVMKPAPTQPSSGTNNDAPSNNGNGAAASDRKLAKLANQMRGKDSFAFDGTISASGENMSAKIYVKGEKVAMEADMGVMAVRIIYANNSVKMIMPSLRCYMTVPADEMGDFDIDELTAALGEIDSDELEYVGTTTEKVDGKNYVCETYNDGVNTNKYYFDSNDNLKRIEIIDASGNKNVTKVNEFSSNVPDSVFDIPSGYTELTEEQLNALMGGY